MKYDAAFYEAERGSHVAFEFQCQAINICITVVVGRLLEVISQAYRLPMTPREICQVPAMLSMGLQWPQTMPFCDFICQSRPRSAKSQRVLPFMYLYFICDWPDTQSRAAIWRRTKGKLTAVSPLLPYSNESCMTFSPCLHLNVETELLDLWRLHSYGSKLETLCRAVKEGLRTLVWT